MLNRPHRLSAGRDISAAVRRGRRAGTPTLVIHVRELGVDGSVLRPRAAFVVGRSVGSAVTRNRVKRQLRHLIRERLDRLPGGVALVVRALPAAAGSSTAVLGRDVDRALARILSETRP